MIIQKTQTFPGMRQGYLCTGKATASTGVITITFTGPDYSAKITGIKLTPVLDSATTVAVCQITSVAYSAGVNTILARVFVSDKLGADLTFSLTNSIVVHYSFWVNDATLPTDQTTNNPATENSF